MQASDGVVLKYFMARTGMFPRTAGHCWQALMAWDPILALQDLLLALEWCEAATLILEDHPSDTQYLNPILGAPAQDPLLTAQDPLLTGSTLDSPGSTLDSPGSTPDSPGSTGSTGRTPHSLGSTPVSPGSTPGSPGSTPGSPGSTPKLT